MKMPQAQSSRNAHRHLTRAILCNSLQKKCRARRTGPVLCEPAQKPCHAGNYEKNAAPQKRDPRFARACADKSHLVRETTRKMPSPPFCANLRSRNAHGHLTRAMLCNSLQKRCRDPTSGPAFCASLRGRNAHGNLTRATLREN
jgi:hypothetical protein